MGAPSTACATGLHAIGQAFTALQRREAPIMIAGSTEACIDAVSLNGFARMRALSTNFNDQPGMASRPFDKLRDGFVMGEGAGVLPLYVDRMQRA
jgi:3-oxoacyl-[acyl-carrier-protein] synthase II